MAKVSPFLISILRDNDYLSPDYSKKAHELYDKYHLIESDPKVSLKEKKRTMEEWWTRHFDLLIRSGLNKKHIEKVIKSGYIKFRKGFSEFINFLKK